MRIHVGLVAAFSSGPDDQLRCGRRTYAVPGGIGRGYQGRIGGLGAIVDRHHL